jgi:hypothetical protein
VIFVLLRIRGVLVGRNINCGLVLLVRLLGWLVLLARWMVLVLPGVARFSVLLLMVLLILWLIM